MNRLKVPGIVTDHSVGSWLSFFAVVGGFCVGGTHPLLHAAEESSGANTARRGPVQLELELSGSGEDQVLSVTLRNISKKPLVVDRELVFHLFVERSVAGEARQSPELLSVAEKPKFTKEGWRKRFAPLQPGEAVSRKIQTQKAFRTFSFGRSLAPEMVFPGQEYWKHFPKDNRMPLEYEVYIEGSYGFWNAFAAYTSLGKDAPDIFEGPIQARIRLDGEKKVTDTESAGER